MATAPQAWHSKCRPVSHLIPKTGLPRPLAPDAAHKPDLLLRLLTVGEQQRELWCHAPPVRLTAESAVRIPNQGRWSLRQESTILACAAVPLQAQSAGAGHRTGEHRGHPPLYLGLGPIPRRKPRGWRAATPPKDRPPSRPHMTIAGCRGWWNEKAVD